MPNDIAQARQIQGHHANHLARQIHRAPPTLAAPERLNGAGPLHIRNRPADCLVAALLFSTAVAQLRLPDAPPRRPHAGPARAGLPGSNALRPHAVQPPPRRSAGLGVHASPAPSYSPMEPGDGSTAQLLNHVGNGALTGCVVPGQCTRSLVAGAVASLGVLAAGALGYLAGSTTHPPCASDTPAPADRTPSVHALLNLLPAAERQQVWEIVRACRGDPDCAIPEIRTLLEQLPPDVQQHLAALLPVAVVDDAAEGWPPGAHAVVMPPGANWIDQLANVLGIEISAEEAAYELDVAAIADATRESPRPGSLVKQRHYADEARRDAIFRLFEDAGFNVERRPFTLDTRTHFGFPYRSSGQNLVVTLEGAGPVKRSLMLLAHGDVMGAEEGSTGSMDNASGVAAVLALARRLRAEGLPDGTRVQFLVTDKEELGLHGAKAYVDACLDAGDADAPCPDVALNLDLMGDGDGMTVSGSAEHLRYRDGDSRARADHPTPVPAAEAQLTGHLRQAATAAGLRIHDTTNWTLQSDHIAFQRRGLPALGISLMDAADIPLERANQQAVAHSLRLHEAVDWSKYDAYLAGTLNRTEEAAFERQVGLADEAARAYQALPPSGRRQQIHGPADQPDLINSRTAVQAIRVLHAAVGAWLAMPRRGAN